MADKTEQQLTEVKKRLDAHDRAIATVSNAAQNVVALPQSFKTLSDDLKALKSRVDTIDAAVKTLAVQMVLKKDLSTAKQLDVNERDKEAKALELRLQAEAKSMADKQKKEADAYAAKMQAMIQEQIAKAQAQNEKIVNEARLATIEARLKAVESRPK